MGATVVGPPVALAWPTITVQLRQITVKLYRDINSYIKRPSTMSPKSYNTPSNRFRRSHSPRICLRSSHKHRFSAKLIDLVANLSRAIKKNNTVLAARSSAGLACAEGDHSARTIWSKTISLVPTGILTLTDLRAGRDIGFYRPPPKWSARSALFL